MKLYQLLVESRIDFLRDKYFDNFRIFFERSNMDKYEYDNIFDLISSIDPTNNKIYLQWLLNNLLKCT